MRKPYIDNTRSLTILLVVLYHVIYMFNHVATDGVIGPVTAFHGQDALQYLLYPWFMVILFILSGMCSRFYLEKHTEKEYPGKNQEAVSAFYYRHSGIWMGTGVF